MITTPHIPLVMGIPNCDSVRKARRWLEARAIDHEFRDVRKQPLTAAEVKALLQATGAAAFVNRKSSTWRTLDGAGRSIVEQAIAQPQNEATQAALVSLMTSNQTMIKRPVLVLPQHVGIGFVADEWDRLFPDQAV